MRLQKNGYAIVKASGEPVQLLSHKLGYWQTDAGEYTGRELRAVTEEDYDRADIQAFFDEVRE
jgi:hypothetical protein